MKDKIELIFGYGSLMSYRGLFRDASKKINILNAVRVQIKADRGFAKPSKSRYYCMDIDNFKLKGSVIENVPKPDYIEGLVFQIYQEDFSKYCTREGYSKGDELITYSSNFNSISEALWKLSQDTIGNDYYQSISNYREELREKIKYTSSHYIPHPLLIKNLGYAITFIAPGKYGTGNANKQSRKEREEIFHLMNVIDVLKRNDVNKVEFLEYFLECILGGVHGINIRDIIDSVSEDSEFFNILQKILTKELIIEEKKQFANTIFGNLERYEYIFGNLDQNLSRSGLKLILDFGNQK